MGDGVDAELEVEEGEVMEDGNLPVATRPTGTALVARDELTVDDIVKQMETIEQAMKLVMKPDVHYGVIPGTNKPTLLQPGAQKLNVLFRLAPSFQTERTWHDDGHLTVVSTCVLTHIPTGFVVASGDGLCSTREKRYAQRRAQRVCPSCGQPQIKRSKFPPKETDYEGASTSDDPGWYCWKKEGGCGRNFAANDPAITGQEEGTVDNPDVADLYNCVTPDTRILTRDLRWVPAGELSSGDVLVGVQEAGEQYGRPYEDAIVTIGERFEDDLYEVRMEDGRVVRCNGEHRWLVKRTNSGVEWASTATIYEGMTGNGNGGRPRRSWRILSTGVWDREDSAEAGYLAGLFDADGSLDVGNHRSGNGYHLVGVSFGQQKGGVLDRLCYGLSERGFDFGAYEYAHPLGAAPVVRVQVRGGFFEQMRLLGTVRPPRLLERWMDLVDLRRRRFEGAATKVESVAPIGRGELVRLGTTSHTYVAEGLVCHNTVLKMSNKRALIAATINGTAASDVFTQDVEDGPSGMSGSPAGDPPPPATTAPDAAPPPATATETPRWVPPETPTELVGRLGYVMASPRSAQAWMVEALEQRCGVSSLADLETPARLEFLTLTARVLRDLEEDDEGLDFRSSGVRELISGLFKKHLDVSLVGPQWRLDPSEETLQTEADANADPNDIPF